MFALYPNEAWEVDFARVFDQGIVYSWNGVHRSRRGSHGFKSSLEFVHKHIAERVSGISAANRFTDCATIVSFGARKCGPRRGRTSFQCTGHSWRGDTRLWVRYGGSGCWGVLPWALAPSCCSASRRICGLGKRGRNQFFGWSLHVSGTGAERAPGHFSGLSLLSTREPSETALLGACHP